MLWLLAGLSGGNGARQSVEAGRNGRVLMHRNRDSGRAERGGPGMVDRNSSCRRRLFFCTV